MNNIVLIGRLTVDPELRCTPSGTYYARFQLAVDREYKKPDGTKETDFLPILVWGKQAELVGEYLNKGRLVAVKGRAASSSYTTKEGEKRRKIEIVAESVRFLDYKNGNGNGNKKKTGNEEIMDDDDIDKILEGEDLPF